MTKAYAWLAVGCLFLGAGLGRSQEVVHGSDPVQQAAASCLEGQPGCQTCGHEHHSLWRWFTYCPEKCNRLECCCHQCAPCCEPPPYLFFLCQGCGSGDYCAACNGNYTCPTCACSGERAHRIYHCHPDKNCAEGGCAHP